jgi:hypothetical protein
MEMLLNEKDVRNLLMLELNETYNGDPNTRIVNELGIDFGASRVDVAVINGIMHGFEIKSDLDTLNRLPRQISYYNKIFERMTIVSSRKYYDEVKELVPNWWGIKVISADGTRLINKRKGKMVNQQSKDLLLKLLWKKDLENFIDFLGFPKKMKKMKKNQLLEIFSQEVDIKEVRHFTYLALKNRLNWRDE